MLKMKQGPKICYSEAQKAMMWERWQKGDSLHAVARFFDRGHSSVQWADWLLFPRAVIQ
jgi:hypothetical protein